MVPMVVVVSATSRFASPSRFPLFPAPDPTGWSGPSVHRCHQHDLPPSHSASPGHRRRSYRLPGPPALDPHRHDLDRIGVDAGDRELSAPSARLHNRARSSAARRPVRAPSRSVAASPSPPRRPARSWQTSVPGAPDDAGLAPWPRSARPRSAPVTTCGACAAPGAGAGAPPSWQGSPRVSGPTRFLLSCVAPVGITHPAPGLALFNFTNSVCLDRFPDNPNSPGFPDNSCRQRCGHAFGARR